MKGEYKQVAEQLAKETARLESVRQIMALHKREILALQLVERDLTLSIGCCKHFLGKHGVNVNES